MSNPEDPDRTMSPELPYALVDVFAETALEGNMLAIFRDARGLSTEKMQALARETNLAETTFILPRDPVIEAAEGVKVRIFTTQEELRFAGHPTLGTAAWLHEHHPVLRGQERITLDLPVGPIHVHFKPGDEAEAGIFGTMQQNNPVFATMHAPAAISHATGIPLEDLHPSLPVQTVSTGMPFCIVPLRSQEALGRLSIPQPLANAYLESSDAKFFYCIAPADSGPRTFRARMQFYSGEDPATGSAAGCAISYLVDRGVVASDTPAIIEQGIEIGRPSRIHVRAITRDRETNENELEARRKIIGVFVGGRTISVARGCFFRY